MDDRIRNLLIIPLYGLLYVEELDVTSLLNEDRISCFRDTYDSDRLAEIEYALKWAEENPVDFAQILPGLKLENDKVRLYLAKLRRKLFSPSSSDPANNIQTTEKEGGEIH